VKRSFAADPSLQSRLHVKNVTTWRSIYVNLTATLIGISNMPSSFNYGKGLSRNSSYMEERSSCCVVVDQNCGIW
jgi:hypothetical protein